MNPTNTKYAKSFQESIEIDEKNPIWRSIFNGLSGHIGSPHPKRVGYSCSTIEYGSFFKPSPWYWPFKTKAKTELRITYTQEPDNLAVTLANGEKHNVYGYFDGDTMEVLVPYPPNATMEMTAVKVVPTSKVARIYTVPEGAICGAS